MPKFTTGQLLRKFTSAEKNLLFTNLFCFVIVFIRSPFFPAEKFNLILEIFNYFVKFQIVFRNAGQSYESHAHST